MTRWAARLLEEGGGLLAAVPLWLWWAAGPGGDEPAEWLPGVLWLGAAVAVLALAGPPRCRPGRAAGVALAAAAALVTWALLSVIWADDRGAAWLTAVRGLMIALAFGAAMLWPPSPRLLRAAVALAVLTGVAALVSAFGAAWGGMAGALDDGRLSAPLLYPNAVAGLLLATGLAAALLSGAARSAAGAAAAGAAAGALLSGVVLTQSRGVLAVAAVALAATLLLTPARLRALAVVVAAAAVAVLGWDVLTEVRRAALDGDPDAALGEAALVLAAAAALSALAALAARKGPDPFRTPHPRRVHEGPDLFRSRRAQAAAGALAATAVAIAFVVGGGAGWVQDRWDSFRTPDYSTLESSDTRFTGDLGSNRYDYWRSAVDVIGDRPLLGEGGGNFAAAYLLRRRSEATPRHAHSLWLGAGAGLGLPGLLALLVAAAALAAALLGALRRAAPAERAVLVAALAPAVALGLQGSADWVHTFALLTVPAAGLAGAVAARGTPAPRRSPRLPLAARRAVAVLALAGLAVLVVPLFVAARLEERAGERAATNPVAADADFRAAARWDPLSARPHSTRGALALLGGRDAIARTALLEAARRDPSSWFARYGLGLVAAREGDRPAALARLAQARALNPREPSISTATALVRAGRPIDVRGELTRLLR